MVTDHSHPQRNIEGVLFEIRSLQFVNLLMKAHTSEDALAFARQHFASIDEKDRRTQRKVARLLGAVAFAPNLRDSPYNDLMGDDARWELAANRFREAYSTVMGMCLCDALYKVYRAGVISAPGLATSRGARRLLLLLLLPLHHLLLGSGALRGRSGPWRSFLATSLCPTVTIRHFAALSATKHLPENPATRLSCGHVLCMNSIAFAGM